MTLKLSSHLLVAHGCSLKQTLLRKFSSRVILKRWYNTDVGTFLAIHRIAQYTKCLNELKPVDIARDFHRARTSSRTK